MKALCGRVRDILLEESNVHLVQSPVTVCGDIHGQFWDVLEIFRQGGDLPDTSYIFMVRLHDMVNGTKRIDWTGRLCGPGVLLLRDGLAAVSVEGEVSHRSKSSTQLHRTTYGRSSLAGIRIE
jgi:hypothetical protein